MSGERGHDGLTYEERVVKFRREAELVGPRDAELTRLRQELALCKMGLLEQRGTEISSLREEVAALTAERDKMREALVAIGEAARAIEQKYQKIMDDPPGWTRFTEKELSLIREAWYGASSLLTRGCLAKVREALGK